MHTAPIYLLLRPTMSLTVTMRWMKVLLMRPTLESLVCKITISLVHRSVKVLLLVELILRPNLLMVESHHH